MTYKVIVRDPKFGTEEYIDGLDKNKAIAEASKQADDKSKQVYVSFAKADGTTGYLNREGPTDKCPGEPW
ncbi:hypothetical protein [Christensenella timonensis]|uniref:hypothetical protein n=1 Tax=Christensenella timonensis TaxID=1816678 RepID=UPI0008372F57|nr:hypothetical protein [Christensenella timonensis]